MLHAPASEGNVPSFGLLQPADSIVLITANWLYGLPGFAETDKAEFPRLCFFTTFWSVLLQLWNDLFNNVVNEN